MSCAQCEEAEATVRCVDEGLQFCGPCSAQLHSKKARQNHEVGPLRSPLLCDECENALAELECLCCGGRTGALVFCPACSGSLHARTARVAHHIASISKETLQGREKPVRRRVIVDLSDLESEQDNHVVVAQRKVEPSGRKLVRKLPVKERPRETEKVEGKQTAGRSAGDQVSKKGLKQRLTKVGKSLPQAGAGRQSNIAALLKFEVCKITTEESSEPENKKRRTPNVRVSKSLPAKNERRSSVGESSSSSPERNESEDEYGGVHRIKRGSVSLEAFVVDANDQEEAGRSDAIPKGKVETGIKDRIKKMLELGLHPDTPEIEAQQALKNAQRLLTKYNLQQAEVLKGSLTDMSSLTGGMRVVELRAKGKTKGRMEAWVQELGWVIADNFDCQYFFKTGTSSKPLRVVFYGISHNADCAGYAFAATFNRITTMSAAYITTKTFVDNKENQSARLRQANQSIYTRVARTNYRKGIVAGLKEAVKRALRVRKTSIPKDEGQQDHVKACNTGYNSGCENDGEDNFTPFGEQKGTRDGMDDSSDTRVAQRSMTITALVMHSQKVGEEFLKLNKIKLRKRALPDRIAAWNEEAYVQGKKDAESIDINQKGITGSSVQKSKGSGR